MFCVSRVAALIAAALLAPLAAAPTHAAEPVGLVLKDHAFTPAEIRVAPGERFRIEVTNQDATPAEFESADLRVEKIVTPGRKIGVMAGPLKPGTYTFFDDYHPDTAKGVVIVTGPDNRTAGN